MRLHVIRTLASQEYRDAKEGQEPMQIVCSTDDAATRVLRILLAARLLPRRDYEIQPTFSSTPPIIFTLLAAMPNERLTQIQALADTQIVTSASPLEPSSML